MIIAVNTRIVSGNTASANLLNTCFEKIALQHPEHSFIFISEKKNTRATSNLYNTSDNFIEQQSNNPLFWKLWYNYKLPALLRKIKADVLLSADGICSLRTKLPQLVIVNELLSKENLDWYPKNYQRFAKNNQQAFFKKAVHVFSMSKVLQQQIIQQQNIDSNKVSVLYPGFNENYQPLKWDAKEHVKKQYTEEKDYFLFVGSTVEHSNLINLLKAFSFFKKRQKSNMQLMIISDETEDATGFKKSLDTYKFRKEVIFLENQSEEERYKITAAAYAFVSPLLHKSNFSKLLNVLQCKVPVVVSGNEINRELLADAALYVDPANFEDIADKMMLLFKDEDGRSRLIEKAFQHSQQFTWQQTADLLWQHIETAIQ